MGKISIVVRHDGVGWCVATKGDGRVPSIGPRPYRDRGEAISDALFAARMIEAMGETVSVLLEGSDGLHAITEEPVQLWPRH